MSTIKSTLGALCSNDFVRSGLIITKDGMIIESALENISEAETLGAFMSQIVLTIRNSLSELGHKDFTRYVIQSSKGQIFLMDLGQSVMIALTDLDVDIAKVNIALFQAATEIKKSGRLNI
ncbi:hypothetical protein MNBD_NITROSPINAE04-1173 [hydrothermal vent metagenome]|uniref:Roadblock/LAMTOR2 domain-containing protein n=1 Tax=hydrothermal vent metagenome TaxID=652676 RepID=A0A3B1B8Y8_9ZZZZ